MSPSPALTQADQPTQDLSAIQDELWRWCAAEVIADAEQIAKFDLVRFWRSKKREYPILYKVALDIIRVQVSAVPCEPVFLSNKETDTDRRSYTSGSLTQILQILKYLGRSRS